MEAKSSSVYSLIGLCQKAGKAISGGETTEPEEPEEPEEGTASDEATGITVTGAGLTIGLVIYMFFMAKSKQMKTLGRLELVPALFNINEPILFGLPIVMNPVLAFPFIAMPVIACILQYVALYTGLCPLYGATQVPWTCPPIISGFLIGGWRTALLQLIIFIISFFVYLPFARRVDKLNLVKEAEAEKEGNDDDW